MQSIDSVLNGKNLIDRIVCIEPRDDNVEVFIEHESGNIESRFFKRENWLLSDKCLDPHFKPLKGNLHYKWIKTYTSSHKYRTERYMYKSEDLFQAYNPKESCMMRDGYTYYKGMRHDEASVLSFDIESTGLKHDEDSKVLIISNTFRKKGVIQRKMFCYDDYQSQGDMLLAWSKWVRFIDPSIIVGHNILMYDLPYMLYIAYKEGVELYLGRDGSALQVDQYDSKFRKDANTYYDYRKVSVYGREVIDTLFLAYKYDVGRKYESYGLKQIIKQENLEVRGRQHYDASTIRHNYKKPEEWTKIKKYAEFDADDSLNLYNLMSPAFFYLAQNVPRSFQHIVESAPGGQINSIMCRAYLQQGHSLPKTSPAVKYEGALSAGNAGIYHNVYKIDVASLYPNIMLQWKIFDKDKDPEGYFYQLVNTWTTKRLEYKKKAKKEKYYEDLSAAMKIFANSAYGYMGSTFNNFNSPKSAALVTQKGREILTQTIKWAEDKGVQIVNLDTDSISFCYSDHREISEVERKALLDDINKQLPERIKYEDDGYYKTVIVLRAKNYILYDGFNIKYKGSAVIATQKEPALKEFIKELLNSMLEGKKDYVDVYNKYVTEIANITDIKRWASKKTVSATMLAAKRKNEAILKAAIAGKEYAEGDKIYTFYEDDDTVRLVEDFKGVYDKHRLYEKLYKTTLTFETVLDKSMFINYSLKRNQSALAELTSTMEKVSNE